MWRRRRMEGSWVAQSPTYPGTRSTVAFSSPSVNGPRPAPLSTPPWLGVSSARWSQFSCHYCHPATSSRLFIHSPSIQRCPVHDSQAFTRKRALTTRHIHTLATPDTIQRPSVSPVQSSTAKVGLRPPARSKRPPPNRQPSVASSHRRIVARIQSILHFPPDPDSLDS